MQSSLLNLFFPPQCLACNMLVPTHGTLCTDCWKQIPFISAPICECCGLPLEYAVDEHTLCGECLRERPPYSRARAAFAYNDQSRTLILKLKYQDEAYLAPIFASWLKSAGAPLIAVSDAIIPVPLHYWRMVSRRYNQSGLLAKGLAKYTKLPLLSQTLKRIRATGHQTGLSQNQREQNMKNAFAVPESEKEAIYRKNILLIDDVMTTGATLHACTNTLIKAGASSVNVLTLARAAT